MEKYRVGVIGGTGMVGQRFVTLLENHPWFQLTAIAASSRSAGKTYEEATQDYYSILQKHIQREVERVLDGFGRAA